MIEAKKEQELEEAIKKTVFLKAKPSEIISINDNEDRVYYQTLIHTLKKKKLEYVEKVISHPCET